MCLQLSAGTEKAPTAMAVCFTCKTTEICYKSFRFEIGKLTINLLCGTSEEPALSWKYEESKFPLKNSVPCERPTPRRVFVGAITAKYITQRGLIV